MANVIELENDIYYEIDEDTLFDQGIIKLNTDLHPDHTEEALVNILFAKHLLHDNDKIIDIYLKVLEDIDKTYTSIVSHLFEINHIEPEDMERSPHDLLDIDLIKTSLRYFGGYPSFFKRLGYKIVELYDTYAIVQEDIEDELVKDYTYGYHYYVVTYYHNGRKVESIRNVHIRNEKDLINFVSGQFNLITDFYLVNNPLTSRNYPSIPKVNKIIKEYDFEPVDEIISDYHLSSIDSIIFYTKDLTEVSISGHNITALRINGEESFDEQHSTIFANDLFIHIDVIDETSKELVEKLQSNESILAADRFEIKYLNDTYSMFILDVESKINTISSDGSNLTINMSNNE